MDTPLDSASDEPDVTFETPGQRIWRGLGGEATSTWALTRGALVRGMGAIYAIAFWIVIRQWRPLLGDDGLLPVSGLTERAVENLGSRGAVFVRLPSLFWFVSSDPVVLGAAWGGLVLAIAAVLGRANAVTATIMWALYLSIANVGQVFYGFGWESLVCEAGFLLIFAVPAWRLRPAATDAPPVLVLWLYRWLLFRVMFGAGLIKLRGDPCWHDLTCLMTHYETQPNPNPLSWYFHHLPGWVHRGGVLFNHFVELVVPWFVFGPRRARHIAGALTALFQVTLILSGNLAFLNWLTLVVCIPCFDDTWWSRLTRRPVPDTGTETTVARRVVTGLLVVAIGLLSIGPTLNLLSPHQQMNRSYDALRLVNTYGAFGSVGRRRLEVVLEGTLDEVPDEDADWRELPFRCKPGAVDRAPCWISPYHLRIDWQMWFLQYAPAEDNPWFVHLVYRLLQGDPMTERLLADDPFPEGPPRYIRAVLYTYAFTDHRRPGGVWWERERRSLYMYPVAADDPDVRAYLVDHGLLDE